MRKNIVLCLVLIVILCLFLTSCSFNPTDDNIYNNDDSSTMSNSSSNNNNQLTSIYFYSNSFDVNLNLENDIYIIKQSSSASNSIYWSIDDTDYATIISSNNSFVRVKGKKIGSTTLTARSDNGLVANCTLNIKRKTLSYSEAYQELKSFVCSSGYLSDNSYNYTIVDGELKYSLSYNLENNKIIFAIVRLASNIYYSIDMPNQSYAPTKYSSGYVQKITSPITETFVCLYYFYARNDGYLYQDYCSYSNVEIQNTLKNNAELYHSMLVFKMGELTKEQFGWDILYSLGFYSE